MSVVWVAVLVLVLSGCAAPRAHVSQSATVRPANAEQVAGCVYVDDLVGTSGWYGVFASQGAENARQEALLKAETLGATHVVWQSISVVYGSTSIGAKAYRCTAR